jgi:hypothetical protein
MTGLHLLAGLGDALLDPSGVDAPVADQVGERDAGDLPPHRVERGEDDALGRVVDDEVHPRQRLEGADVAPLPPDDAAFHVVGGELDGGDGRFGGLIHGAPLDGERDDLPGAPLRFALDLLLVVLDPAGLLALQLVVELAEELLSALLDGQVGYPLQLPSLGEDQVFRLAAGEGDLLFAGFDLGFLLLQVFQAPLERFLLLSDAGFQRGELRLALPVFLLYFLAKALGLLLRFEQQLFASGFGLPFGALARAAELLFRCPQGRPRLQGLGVPEEREEGGDGEDRRGNGGIHL